MQSEKRTNSRARLAAIAPLALCVALAVLAAPALALRGHEFGKAFATAGLGPGQLKEPAGITVNEATHQLYVVDKGNNRVEVFSRTGEFKGQFDGSGTFEFEGSLKSGKPAKAGALSEPGTIAVDNVCVQKHLSEASKPTCKEFDPSNGDVYVQDGSAHKVVDKFSPQGDFIAQLSVPITEGSMEMAGVAVDSQGHPWIAELQNRSGFAWFSDAEAGEEVNLEELAHPADIPGLPKPGLALDTHGNIFSATKPSLPVITKFSPPVAGIVHELREAIDEEAAENGEAASGVAVEIPANSIYVDNETSIRRFDDEEPPKELERFGQGHLSKGSGVAVNAASETVWVADRGADSVVEFKREEPRAPTIERESSAAITADSASLQAEINPRSEPSDAPTEYHFEYGRCTTPTTCKESGFEASTPVPDGPVGSDFEEHEVSAPVQGLLPATTYHFRVLAHNEKGETAGEELSFTTQPAGVLGSLDGRGYELVSPAQKHGTLIKAISGATPIQAALAGNAITYTTSSPSEAEPSGYADAVQVLSSRSASGWSSKDVTIAHPIATGQSIGAGAEYRFSSEDLAKGILQPLGAFEPGLSPLASEQTPYLRSNYESADPSHFCSGHCLTPLVTARNVAEGVAFGEEGKCPTKSGGVFCGPQFLGANADLSEIVLHSEIGLSGLAGDHGGLYEWSGGHLSLVSVLPSGKPASPAKELALGRNDEVMRDAISPDGDRVVWSDGAHLYLRKVAEEATVELDAGMSGKPEFQTANSQTQKIFFSEEGGLYLYDTQTNQRTTLVKAGGGVQGTIVGASEDGSYLYFVANEALAGVGGAVRGNCKGGASSSASSCNLYELHETGGGWQARLVAVLSGEDFADFAQTLSGLTARVSPDGNYLAFMSRQPLSGYDNRDAKSAKRDEEVFEFDAGTGALSCASCRPTGARPEGVEYAKLQGGLAGGFQVWHTTSWLAANVPGAALHQSRYLSNSGRLFFNSADALAPQDVNGTEDVYEYEPPGVGGCSEATPSFSSRLGGCVGLISSGTSREESAFMDASESGGDVFFLTSSQLVAQDFDTALDIYDAHECTSSSPCIKSAEPPGLPCASEASCKAPPTPQPEIFGAPASATFSGAGNIVATPPAAPKPLSKAQLLTKALASCRAKHKGSSKRAKRSRGSCEAQAKRKYGAKAPARKSSKKKKKGKKK
jgi:DNA-binding beta-propeller fold protein YncE